MEETDSPLPPPVKPKPVENGKDTDNETSPEITVKPEETPVEENGEEVSGSKKEQPTIEIAVAEEKEDEKEEDLVAKSEGVTLVVSDDAKDSASDFDGEVM